MKITSTLSVLLFVSPVFSYCQSCLPEGYDFNSQWAIDNFTDREGKSAPLIIIH